VKLRSVHLIRIALASHYGFRIRLEFWDPHWIIQVSVVVAALVLAGLIGKLLELRGGGSSLATQLGARKISHSFTTPDENKLLNIVEEMAIASSLPTPELYVIDTPGINAFAAGFSPRDAIIGVTPETMKLLNREELQGVIGHEFSHILNGDMRLNFWLLGLVNGLELMAITGLQIIRFFGNSSGTSTITGRKGRSGGPPPLLAFAAILVVAGGVGVFFGKLIRSAVCRQREFLADASSVQFTRNPSGIAGALKKIGSWLSGNKPISFSRGEQISHMLFTVQPSKFFAFLFSTHPPLEDRIKAIDPSFTGSFPSFASLETDSMAFVPPSPVSAPDTAASPRSVLAARALMDKIPARLRAMTKEAYSSRALILALLIDKDAGIRSRQLDAINASSYSGLLPLIRETVDLLAKLSLSLSFRFLN
jgi:Zn-dependent protease with chaperone function